MSTSFFVLVLFGVSLASGHGLTCEERIQEELERERQVDTETHDCRSCDAIRIDAVANCPDKGYECDESLPLITSVLRPGDCSCSQLRCAASNATLAVGGDPVGQVQCKERTWNTPKGEATESAVCARKCGRGVCPTTFNNVDPLSFGPLSVQLPDENHRCAWAECQIGAVASEGSVGVTINGKSDFACSGDKTWTYTGPGEEKKQLTNVACVLKGCDLDFIQTWPAEECETYWKNYGPNPQTVTCSSPIVEAMSFSCPGGTYPSAYSGMKAQHKSLAKVACNAATKKWEFTVSAEEGLPPRPEDEFTTYAGGPPIQFACVRFP